MTLPELACLEAVDPPGSTPICNYMTNGTSG